MADVVEGTDDPTKAFLSIPPIEDSGAPTQARFEWQNAMAAVDALRGYADWLDVGRPADFDFRITCELHEDWNVHRGGRTEMVSAKHREPQVGPFRTHRELLDDGGVLHLLQNWLLHKQTVTCRLVTTTDLGGEARDLGKACEDLREHGVTDSTMLQHAGALDKFIRTAEKMDDDLQLDRPMAAAFLAGFSVDGGRPRYDQIDHFAPSGYAAPVAALLNRSRGEQAVWRAVLSVMRPKMQGNGPTPRAALPTGNGSLTAKAERRSVTLPEIDTMVLAALERADGYVPPPRVYDTTNLGIKMTVGSLSSNVIRHAQRLRLRYLDIRNAALEIPGESERFEVVESNLRRLIRKIEQTTGTNAKLWHELEEQLESLAGTGSYSDLTIDNLTGAIAELSEQCELWFSDEFDLPAARRRIRAGGHP